MITSYEVEFGPQIGSGSFGQVFKGIWNNIEVALKVMTTETNNTTSHEAVHREIQVKNECRTDYRYYFLFESNTICKEEKTSFKETVESSEVYIHYICGIK